MATQLKITFIDGRNLGEDYRLDLDAPRLLGRTHTADVLVSPKDRDVSGRHLEFVPDGEGAAVRCLSKHGLKLNGDAVREGEQRPLHKGDEIEIGMRVKIRVDGVGPSAGNAAATENETLATRVQGATIQTVAVAETEATRPFEATLETRPVDGTLVTRPVEATLETRPVDGTLATRAAGTSFTGSFAETPVGEAQSVAPTHFAAQGLHLDFDSETVKDAVTGGLDAPSFTGADSPSVSGTSDGKTVGIETRDVNMDVVKAIAEERERVRRFRQRLITVAVFGALAVLGALVYWRWPRAERWLSHPQPIVQHAVKDSAGITKLFVDYPQNARTRTSPRANGGIDVESMTGKSKNVPFRLSMDIRKDASELDLSLEKSAEREMAGLVRQGYVFEAVGPDGGFGFFEGDYPKSCQNGGTQRGVRFCRREFTRSDSAGQWHGVLIYFRDVDTVYRLLREIPDPEWPRGQWLLRDDPNLALYAGFMNGQWESPGADALQAYSSRKPQELLKSVDAALERNLPSEWKETALMIDALLLAGLKGDSSLRDEAKIRLERLRKAKRLFYDECLSRRDCGAVKEAYSSCKGAFGGDKGDLRYWRLGNNDEWRPE